jgi:hypothetical protein
MEIVELIQSGEGKRGNEMSAWKAWRAVVLYVMVIGAITPERDNARWILMFLGRLAMQGEQHNVNWKQL